jgi:hypothetical protein
MAPRRHASARAAQVARRVRWAYVLEAARWLYTHGRQSWDRLSPRERRELSRIVRKARGGPRTVTPSEREELRRIVLKALGMGS